jgi:thioredoxin 1
MIRELSKNIFSTELTGSGKISLVQFKVEWIGACQIIAPVYFELSEQYNSHVNFYTIDVEDEKGLMMQYGISELPTILFFRAGEIIDYIAGLVPKKVIESKIEHALSTTLK